MLVDFVALLHCLCTNNFEKGYYIDNSGLTHTGYLRVDNVENINAASGQIEFKIATGAAPTRLSQSEIKEFGVDGQLKFQKMLVSLDDVNLSQQLSYRADFNPKPQTVFLKAVVEGEASLYAYPGLNGTKYFFSVKDKQPIAQLLYKKYLSADDHETENTAFREQLFTAVLADGQTISDFLSLSYKKSDLMTAIVKYNQSKKVTFTVYAEKFKASIKARYIVMAGIHSKKFNIEGLERPLDAQSKIGITPALEAEFLLLSRKIALWARGGYESLKLDFSEQYLISNNTYTIDGKYALDYKAINVTVGPRFYFNDSSKYHKFYADLGAMLFFASGDFKYTSTLTNAQNNVIDHGGETFDFSNGFCFNLGAGYLFNSKFGIDLRMDTNKNLALTSKNNNYKTKFQEIGVTLRYILN